MDVVVQGVPDMTDDDVGTQGDEAAFAEGLACLRDTGFDGVAEESGPGRDVPAEGFGVVFIAAEECREVDLFPDRLAGGCGAGAGQGTFFTHRFTFFIDFNGFDGHVRTVVELVAGIDVGIDGNRGTLFFPCKYGYTKVGEDGRFLHGFPVLGQKHAFESRVVEGIGAEVEDGKAVVVRAESDTVVHSPGKEGGIVAVCAGFK